MHEVFRDMRMSHNKFYTEPILTNNTSVDSIHYLLNPLIHWGSIKCHQSPFLFCSYFSVFAGFTEKRYTAEGSVVSWLLLRSILIAAFLKARHVPFTVLIPICVIDFEAGRSAIVELQQSIQPPTPTEILRRSNLQTDANQNQLKLPVNVADEGRAVASPGGIAEQHFEAKSVSMTVCQISV